MPCYSSNTSLSAASIDDSTGVTYFASLANQTSIRFTFLPPSGGSITSIACTPPGPSVGTDYIEFATAHIDNSYVVTITYSTSGFEDKGGPLVTPVKVPTFKPVVSCPT
jgi:hypothetical protein